MLNQTPPKISIIIGVLNMKEHLSKTLDSVIRQNYPYIELMVMDGGSTDGTLDVIKEYEYAISYWQSEKDKGHADACNKAIDKATGDLIHFLNADDVLDFGLINNVAAMYQRYPATKVITCGVKIVEQHGDKMRLLRVIDNPNALDLSLETILFGLPVINARFFHKSIFKQFGKFVATHPDGSYNLSNDREFLIALTLAGIKTRIVSHNYYYYLSHAGSLTFSGKNIIKSYNEHLSLAGKYLDKKSLSPGQKQVFVRWQARERVYLFIHYVLRGNIKSAVKLLRSGFSYRQLFFLLSKAFIRRLKRIKAFAFNLVVFLKRHIMPVH